MSADLLDDQAVVEFIVNGYTLKRRARLSLGRLRRQFPQRPPSTAYFNSSSFRVSTRSLAVSR